MTSSSNKVDPILSAPTFGDFKKWFYNFLVKDGPPAAWTAPRLHYTIFDAIALNMPPDVESQTLDEYAKIIEDTGDTLLEKLLQEPQKGLHFSLQTHSSCPYR